MAQLDRQVVGALRANKALVVPAAFETDEEGSARSTRS
jgi:hypothetical protein